jgi:hypothetical protein
MALWHVLSAGTAQERDVVLLPLLESEEADAPTRKQAFYLSSGTASARRDTWLPFDGIVDHLVWSTRTKQWSLQKWYDKRRFTLLQQLVLERFGSVENARASWRLGGGIWQTTKGETIARALRLEPSERGVDGEKLVYMETADDDDETDQVYDATASQRRINTLVNPTLEDLRTTSTPKGRTSAILLELVQLASQNRLVEQDRLEAQVLCDEMERNDAAILERVVATYRDYFSHRLAQPILAASDLQQSAE